LIHSLDKPNNETSRLKRLQQLNVLDSAPEAMFNAIAKLASDICGVDIAAISLIDHERQWFKSVVGMDVIEEMDRDLSLCSQTILNDTVWEIEDIQNDTRFAHNPLVNQPPNIRFYAGAPLALYGDLNVGTLCLMGLKPHQLSDLHKKMLKGLAEIAAQALLVREAALNELDNESSKLAVIVQTSEDAILSKSLDDVVTTWNPAATKLFGYTEAEMVGESILLLIPKENLEEERFLLEQLKYNLNIQHYETQYMHKNGRLIDVALSLSGIKNAQGVVVEISEIIRDITLQKQMQKTLQLEHELLQVTMDSIGDAVLTTDQQGNVQYLNPVAEQLTGWTSKKAAGKPAARIFKIINEKTRKPYLDPVQMCLDKNSMISYVDEIILMSIDGNEYGIDASTSPIRDGDGNTIGVVMVFHDVSEPRKVSREIAYRASHDMLTGLANRSEFETALKRFVNNSREVDKMNSLMFIDLDRFKAVNDACGHSAGDLLLKEVAEIMQNCVRSSDLVARIGGD
jgi:PAS domain S-box-containing protein